MKIYFTPEGSEQADECDRWWRENRPAVANLFARELAAAAALLLVVPKIGPVYASLDGQPVRRVLMKKTKAHVYYVLEAALGQITIHAVWGAPKRGGPRFLARSR